MQIRGGIKSCIVRVSEGHDWVEHQRDSVAADAVDGDGEHVALGLEQHVHIDALAWAGEGGGEGEG